MSALPAPPVQVHDLRGKPCELEPREWVAHARRDPAAIVGVVLHQWAARVGTTRANRLRYGEPLALARRALGVPYGISCGVTSAGVPVVAIAHPIERYTNASDAGNRYWISVGVMALLPFEAVRWDARRHTAVTDALRAAVDRALGEALHLLDDAPGGALSHDRPLALITHRQCANQQTDHFACPGERVVEMALASEAVRSSALVPDPDRVLIPGVGRPWPASWRRHLRPLALPPPPPFAAVDGVDAGEVADAPPDPTA